MFNVLIKTIIFIFDSIFIFMILFSDYSGWLLLNAALEPIAQQAHLIDCESIK